jgi:hypothetical protein
VTKDNQIRIKSDDLPLLVAPNDLANYLPAVRKGGLRKEIFYAERNGLLASGALIRRGRKCLIDVHKYIEWLRQQSLLQIASGRNC